MRISDWSSDVCSSDLRFKVAGLDCQNEIRALRAAVGPIVGGDDKLSFDTKAGLMEVAVGDPNLVIDITQAVDATGMRAHLLPERDRKSVVSGKSVSVRVDLGGRRILKQKIKYL